MKKLIWVALLAAVVALNFGLVQAAATPPNNPPGQSGENPGSPGDDCSHGASGQECVPDPQPDHGQECDDHGNASGNEDHCLGGEEPSPTPTPTETPDPSPDPSPSESPSPTPTDDPSPTEGPSESPSPSQTPTETPSSSPTETPPVGVGPPSPPNDPGDGNTPQGAERRHTQPRVTLSAFYGDPLIDITLKGPGRFRISGGDDVLRFRVWAVRVVRGYHVDPGATVRVFLNGRLVAQKTA